MNQPPSPHQPGHLNRRDALQIGGTTALGMSLGGLLARQATADGAEGVAASFGKAKSVIILFLLGANTQSYAGAARLRR